MKDEQQAVSIVVPVKNEEENIAAFCDAVKKVLGSEAYELVFVDDGSTDGSWDKIRALADRDKHVKGVSFSRNFGKEAALMAGLSFASGDCVVTIDGDMQHPVEKIPEFIEQWRRGAKVVEGIKLERGKEGAAHRMLAHLFYRILGRSVGRDVDNTSDYKLIDREIADIILKMPEQHMFYRAITSWVGFKTASVSYEVGERRSGKSKWPAGKLIGYAFNNIAVFTSAPLQVITGFGIAFFLLAVVIGAISMIRWLSGNAMEGFTTVILLQLISGSIIMFALGLIGYYLGKIYEEMKKRPRYIISEKLGDFEDKGSKA